MIAQLSHLKSGQLIVVLILGLAILIVVGELLEIIFKVIGKLLAGKRDLAMMEQKTRQAEIALEHDKLQEGVLPVQICSSAGHTCGAPYHPGDFRAVGSQL